MTAISFGSVVQFFSGLQRQTVEVVRQCCLLRGKKSKLPEPAEITENDHGQVYNLTILALSES